MNVHELMTLLLQQDPDAPMLMESQRDPTLYRVTGVEPQMLRKYERSGYTWYEPWSDPVRYENDDVATGVPTDSSPTPVRGVIVK